MPNKDKPKSILVIQLAGLGDIVMATPAIEALRRLYPKAKIFLLINSRSADIIRGFPYIDGIFILDRLHDAFTVVPKLRKYRFDTVINLYRLYTFFGAVKMFLLFWMIAGKYWVGRDTDRRGFFYHLKVPEKLSEQRHEIEYKLDIIRALGAKIEDISLSVEYDSLDEEFVKDLLSKRDITEDDILIAINCSTFRPSHNWLVEHYAELADKIIERLKVKVVFLGVERDRNSFNEIKNVMRHEALNFIGIFTVRQFAVFLKRCRVLISPDTGAIHIASAIGTPVVVLCGPSEHKRYRPWASKEKAVVITKEVECSPCFKYSCRSRKCMSLILPDEVFAAVSMLLEKNNVQI